MINLVTHSKEQRKSELHYQNISNKIFNYSHHIEVNNYDFVLCNTNWLNMVASHVLSYVDYSNYIGGVLYFNQALS